jgi:anti-anti-sigma factor
MTTNVSAKVSSVSAELIAIDPQKATLSGRLDRLTAKKLLQQGRHLIAQSGSYWQIDLTDVHHSSSVGIALLLDWKRYGMDKNVTVEFHHVPQKMQDVIEFSGLKEVFKLN